MSGLDDIHNFIAQDRARLRTNGNSNPVDQSPTHGTASPAMNKNAGDKSRSAAPPPANGTDSPNSPTSNAKTRLTNEQKKKNHIESEKKRRDAIRAGFDRLADVVPGMEGQGRSEAVVLQHTVAFMKGMIAKKKALDAIAAEKGWSPQETLEPYLKVEQEVRMLEAKAEAEAQVKLAAYNARNNKN